MALPRSLSFLRTGTGRQVLEVFIDPLCPPSMRATKAVHAWVLPHLGKGQKYENLSVIMRPYIQPFHYAAPYGAEAWLVFGSEHPDLFWDYLLATFAILDNFGNSKIWDVTPTQIQSAYIDTALDLLEKNNKLTGNREAVHKDMLAKLQVTDYINGGSVMFAESKLLTKYGRQNGIAVTPTAMFDGIVAPEVSSRWTEEEWNKWLGEKLGN